MRAVQVGCGGDVGAANWESVMREKKRGRRSERCDSSDRRVFYMFEALTWSKRGQRTQPRVRVRQQWLCLASGELGTTSACVERHRSCWLVSKCAVVLTSFDRDLECWSIGSEPDN